MKDELINELENKNYAKIKQLLADMLVPDIAEFLEKIDNPVELLRVFKLLDKDTAAEVFSYADSTIQQVLISALTDAEVGAIVEELFIDDAVDIVEEMPANVVEKLLKNSNKETRQTINKLLCYKEDSAGSIMTTEFLDLKDDYTVEDALKRIRKIGKDVETINVLYITDRSRILKGVVTIRELLLAESTQKVVDLMQDNVVFAYTYTDQEDVALDFKKYDVPALPIVDNELRLVGIITFDDIMEIVDQEATEDISKMAAVTPSAKPYLKTSPFKLWLNRVPWLMLLMISATFTGLIISKNEAILQSGVYGIILTACIPMLMDTGGNAGGQASATIIRGIALDELHFKDLFKVVLKELLVGVLVGAAVSVVCFGKILLIDGLMFKTNGVDVLSAAIVSVTMFFAIVIAKLVGCTLPLLAKKLKLDPAVMASPFITTIVDILSLLVFCGLATTFLP